VVTLVPCLCGHKSCNCKKCKQSAGAKCDITTA
jgi:hypothetical protein